MMEVLLRSRLNYAQIRVIVAACGVEIQVEISVNIENQVEIPIINKKFQECTYDIIFFKCPNLYFSKHEV